MRIGIGCVVIIAWCAIASAEDSSTFTPVKLSAPKGYTVEVAAAPPLVGHPLMGAFDPQGRMYVAATAGLNLRRPDLEEQLPNFVQRLEDVDGDGVFDKATKFADKLTFPQGCLWHEGSLYVASSGAIWRFTDDNDDGVADRREKIVGDFGYTGNAADVHGCFLGPEGRIYWCEGRHGHEIKNAQGELVSKGKAARIFSSRADGSDVRSYCTGGMDNPVEIVFGPTGDMFGSVNLMYSRPRGDCLVHWLYGGVYPREDFASSLDGELLRTGDLLREVHNFGHVALSGLCRLRTNQLGDNFAGDLMLTVFNTNRIARMKLAPSKATYKAALVEDFLVADSKDFHPTDVLEDADGSLLVIDTGGWFRIGCPQSQVAKSHIPGAIYRVRRTSSLSVEDPRGRQIDHAKLSSEDFVRYLEDPRPAVVDAAMSALAARFAAERAATVEQELGNQYDKQSVAVRRRLLQAARRAESPRAGDWLLRGLRDADDSVRQTACRALYHAKTEQQTAIATQLIALLQDPAVVVRREAAVVLGQQSEISANASAALLAALGSAEEDPLVRHTLTYALIDLGDREATAKGLLASSASTQAAAAIALEQMRRKNADVRWLEIPAPATGAPLTQAEQDRVLTMLKELPTGDAAAGRAVFFGAKAACASCHRVGEQGGQVGPDITTIGRIRAEGDLLASILYPSASFARGFEPYSVVTDSGRVATGIILAESSTHLHLGLDKENSVRIAASEIEEIKASPISIMPQEVVKQLKPQETADLIAYLKSLK